MSDFDIYLAYLGGWASATTHEFSRAEGVGWSVELEVFQRKDKP